MATRLDPHFGYYNVKPTNCTTATIYVWK